MRLIVDSGSTKADWIAIDNGGKILFTTQTLGLNPEILNSDEIIDRINDRFDILQNKQSDIHLPPFRFDIFIPIYISGSFYVMFVVLFLIFLRFEFCCH